MKPHHRIQVPPTNQALSLLLWSLLPLSLSATAAPYAEGPLIEIIRNMPEGSWKRVDTNPFSDAWPPNSLRTLYAGGTPNPGKIIGAWSSFAWDSNRGDLILYGGGHANYAGNDVYRWRSRNLQWERASLASEVTYVGANLWNAIDGVDAAPSSAHTYDNSVFLPIADRFLTFGGANYNSGGHFKTPSEEDPSVLRFTGPYLFDPDKADPNKVGGTTGSHVQRVAPYADIVGGQMWQNRDIFKHLTTSTLPKNHVNGCTAYNNSPAEHDIIYVVAKTTASASALDLFRYEIHDVDAPWLDSMTKIGRYWASPVGQTTCAHDPEANIVLRTGNNTSPFIYWNLATSSPTNNDIRVSVEGEVRDLVDELDGIGRKMTDCALDYDPNGSRFLLWCGSGKLWAIQPPAPISPNGWRVSGVESSGPEVPPNLVGTGILGKWEYIPGFDVFMGLVSNEGQVWVYKPRDWVDSGEGGEEPDPDPGNGGEEPTEPDPENIAPVVTLSAPAAATQITLGETVALAAQASDEDGNITKVIFQVNGNAVGVVNAAPYTLSWQPEAAGEYSITAQAFDNDGASTFSAAVSVDVVADSTADPDPDPIEPGSSGEVVLQRDAAASHDIADTYLSSYHPTSKFGKKETLPLDSKYYVPLLRFAIFASEGGPVPDGAIIDSAQLLLHKGSYRGVVALHALLQPWSETEASWNQRLNGQPWTEPGAAGAGTDYQIEEDARFSSVWESGWVSFDVANRLQAISTGDAPNNGWRMKWVSGDYNGWTLKASDYQTNLQLRPRLEIKWHMPADGEGPGGGTDPDPGNGGEEPTEPDPENIAPVVTLSAPAAATQITLGETVALAAQASDEDGNITKVIFQVNGNAVGVVNAAPYALSWQPEAAGEYSITAEAFDNDGASTFSTAVSVEVVADSTTDPDPVEPGSSGEVVLQRDAAASHDIADTYLSSYHPASKFGKKETLPLDFKYYVPLLRFAIFASEGGPVPDGAIIDSAQLLLHKGSYRGVVALHALLQPWSETEASWNQRLNGQPWTEPGAAGAGTDYQIEEDARFSSVWDSGWVSFDVTNRLQAVSTGDAPNNGWRMKWISGDYNGWTLKASEYPTNLQLRPKLEIKWHMPGSQEGNNAD